jgi:hypothetical protein
VTGTDFEQVRRSLTVIATDRPGSPASASTSSIFMW